MFCKGFLFFIKREIATEFTGDTSVDGMDQMAVRGCTMSIQICYVNEASMNFNILYSQAYLSVKIMLETLVCLQALILQIYDCVAVSNMSFTLNIGIKVYMSRIFF